MNTEGSPKRSLLNLVLWIILSCFTGIILVSYLLIIPHFQPVFKEMGLNLPIPIKMALGISIWLRTTVLISIPIIILIIATFGIGVISVKRKVGRDIIKVFLIILNFFAGLLIFEAVSVFIALSHIMRVVNVHH